MYGIGDFLKVYVIAWAEGNKPFPSSCLPPFQKKSKCEVVVMKISFHSYVK